jgi:xylose isomerase
MDGLARGLRNAAALLEAGALTKLREDRYASWAAKGGVGEKIKAGKVGFEELEKFTLGSPDPGYDVGSGSQELAEIFLDMATK